MSEDRILNPIGAIDGIELLLGKLEGRRRRFGFLRVNEHLK